MQYICYSTSAAYYEKPKGRGEIYDVPVFNKIDFVITKTKKILL